MKIKKGELIELNIEKMAFKAKGVARLKSGEKSFTVFVNNVAVGDKVKAQVFKLKKRWAEARLIEILEPSKSRIEPKCGHFEECGGCSFQNITYEEQLKLKYQFVVDAFERIGGFLKAPIRRVLKSPGQWFYRNKMELSFGSMEGRDFTLGFHVPGRRYDVFDLRECFLEFRELAQIAGATADLMKKHGMKPVNSKGEGELFTLTVREGKRTNEKLVNITTAKGPFNWIPDFAELMKKFEATSVYWTEKLVQKGLPTTLKEHHLWGDEFLHEKLLVDGREFIFSVEPQAFFQPNTLGAELLYGEVLKQLKAEGKEILFDLYCGTGTIGMVLAPYVKEVIGVELNEQAVNSARRNAGLNGIKNIDFIVGDAAKVLEKLNEKPDIIVLDPPRAGLSPKAIEHVLAFKAKRIVYVSCNPSTLARDCQILCEAGYNLENIQAVDMFPQSYHVENVAALSYNGRK